MKISKTLSVFLAIQLTFGSIAHASGGSRCTFENQLAPDEQALLDGVKTALTNLGKNQACQAQAQQIKTFDQALTAYNQQNSLQATGGISCANYDNVWNSRFNDFSNNWNSPGGSSDSFASCRGKASQEEAINCAALVTSSEKSNMRTSCESQRETITNTAAQELRTQTFQTGISALNDVLLNQECMASAGEQKLNLIQNAVGLASQAATIAMLGTGLGLLVGGAAQLVNAAIGSIFRNPNRQSMAILDNRENFSRIACLYEQVESKALRCERVTASQQVDVLKNMFDTSTQFCATNPEILAQNDLMTSIDQVINKLNVAPAEGTPAQSLAQETFDNLVEQLSEPFPGSQTSKLDVARESTETVVQKLEGILESDDSLKSYLAEKGERNLSRAQLRQHYREISEQKNRAKAVLEIVNAVTEADSKGIRMSEEDLKAVEAKLKSFDAGNSSFTGAFNEIMLTRASFGDNLGNSLAAYNTRLEEAQVHRYRIKLYDDLKRASTTSFDDGGRFEEARNAIIPQLRRTLDRELDTLIDRVQLLSGIRPGAPDRALQETLRTQEESVIYPLLRICNQLRTVMDSSKVSQVDASSRGQPSVCQAFNCANGLNTFENYLQRAGVGGINIERCDVNCRSHYDRFICQEKDSLTTIRAKVRNEFLKNGTICGRSIHDAFRRADGL